MKYLISQTDFQKKVNYTKGSFHRDFIQKKVLPMEGKKLVMPDAEKIYHQLEGGITIVKMEVLEPNEALPINLSGNASMQDLLNAKVKKENALGDLHDVNLKKIQGELISLDDVCKDVVALLEIVRNGFINLPTKIAPSLVDMSATEIQYALDDAVNEILTDLYNKQDEYNEQANSKNISDVQA